MAACKDCRMDEIRHPFQAPQAVDSVSKCGLWHQRAARRILIILGWFVGIATTGSFVLHLLSIKPRTRNRVRPFGSKSPGILFAVAVSAAVAGLGYTAVCVRRIMTGSTNALLNVKDGGSDTHAQNALRSSLSMRLNSFHAS